MGGAEMVARHTGSGSSQTQPATTGPAVDPNDPMRKFLSHVLGSTEDVCGDGPAAAGGRQIHAGPAGDV